MVDDLPTITGLFITGLFAWSKFYWLAYSTWSFTEDRVFINHQYKHSCDIIFQSSALEILQ